mgnify:CR=1 FL=1
MIPRFAIMNPELTCTLPAYQTACGASDILAHLMERYFTRVEHVDFTDRLIEAAMRTVLDFARYYIFGKGGARRYAEENGVDFLGEIPIVQSIMEGSDEGRPAAGIDPRVEKWYREIAEKTVEKVMKSC